MIVRGVEELILAIEDGLQPFEDSDDLRPDDGEEVGLGLSMDPAHSADRSSKTCSWICNDLNLWIQIFADPALCRSRSKFFL